MVITYVRRHRKPAQVVEKPELVFFTGFQTALVFRDALIIRIEIQNSGWIYKVDGKQVALEMMTGVKYSHTANRDLGTVTLSTRNNLQKYDSFASQQAVSRNMPSTQ